MWKSRAAILASVLLIGALNIPLQAAIIYDNGGPNLDSGFAIWETFAAADDFTLEDNTDVVGVGFYFQDMLNLVDWSQDFNYAIYANDGGLLGALLASGSAQDVSAVDSGMPWCCGDETTPNAFLITFNLESAFGAAGGTTYWLELRNSLGFWITADPNGTNVARYNGSSAESELAFHLTDHAFTAGSHVPEPATIGIVGLGVLALPLLRRSRKSASN
jgi:hypothetical protein